MTQFHFIASMASASVVEEWSATLTRPWCFWNFWGWIRIIYRFFPTPHQVVWYLGPLRMHPQQFWSRKSASNFILSCILLSFFHVLENPTHMYVYTVCICISLTYIICFYKFKLEYISYHLLVHFVYHKFTITLGVYYRFFILVST